MPRELHPENLTPFKKGQSGNPGGRPKRPWTDAYKKIASKKIPKQLRAQLKKAGIILSTKATMADAVAYGQILKAIGGNASNASEVREAVEGKATQRLELSGGDDVKPIQVSIVNVDLSRLSDAELEAYEALRRKAAGR